MVDYRGDSFTIDEIMRGGIAMKEKMKQFVLKTVYKAGMNTAQSFTRYGAYEPKEDKELRKLVQANTDK